MDDVEIEEKFPLVAAVVAALTEANDMEYCEMWKDRLTIDGGWDLVELEEALAKHLNLKPIEV